MDFTFTKNLVLHRDVPMAGTMMGGTKTELIGQGYRTLKASK